MDHIRRKLLGGLAASPYITVSGRAEKGWDVVVVGAGVFGAWTAEMLRREGRKVLLVDAWGPANARASSGGESRMTRASYGAGVLYSEMALESLKDWQQLSTTSRLPLFYQTGVLIMYDSELEFASKSKQTLDKLKIPIERSDAAVLEKRWPQINWSGIAFGQYEPDFGALMARRAVATLVANFIENGGAYRQAAIVPPKATQSLKSVRTHTGEIIEADAFVFACGPWLGTLFPTLVETRQFVTRQDVFYFRPPAGDQRFKPEALPGWAEIVNGTLFYGFPDLENRGFKIAEDTYGPIMDFNTNDRVASTESYNRVRTVLRRRFPALANAPLSESRVCQYTNSATSDFLIDRHPKWSNTVLVGMGSGHGFKHGPAVGKRAAKLLLSGDAPHSLFKLAGKKTV